MMGNLIDSHYSDDDFKQWKTEKFEHGILLKDEVARSVTLTVEDAEVGDRDHENLLVLDEHYKKKNMTLTLDEEHCSPERRVSSPL